MIYSSVCFSVPQPQPLPLPQPTVEGDRSGQQDEHHEVGEQGSEPDNLP